MKTLFLVAFLALAANSTVHAADVIVTSPAFTWKIALKTFLNHVQAVRPENYVDRSTCELAMQGMSLTDLHLFGLHGECVYVPITYSNKLSDHQHR